MGHACELFCLFMRLNWIVGCVHKQNGHVSLLYGDEKRCFDLVYVVRL